jgi:pyridoxal phosphate enzyme (YggS family)
VPDFSVISENIRRIRSEIPISVRIVAVSKGRTAEQIRETLSAGISEIGENRVQDALLKIKALAGTGIKWHFIGHLQGNKVREVVENFDAIQSIDSIALAKRANEACAKIGKKMPVFLEVNIGSEPSKFGFQPNDEILKAALTEIARFHNIEVIGLMAIAPLGKDPKPYFREMKRLQLRLGVRELSMGMSDDYKSAVQEGATIVRIGRAIFE